RRERFQLLLVDVGAGAHLVGAEDLRADGGGSDFDRAQGGDVAGELCVDGGDLVQRQVHVLAGGGARTRLGDGDLVRTTHAEAPGAVAAAGVGGDAADRAGLGVHDGDLGAGEGLAIGTEDLGADAGGS